MIVNNCATGTLAVYEPRVEKPWNRQRASHLFRRIGFGASLQRTEEALTSSPDQIVDQMIDEAIALPLPPPPDWANKTQSEYSDFNTEANQERIDWAIQWINDMIQHGFREKMALFWHNHFVTQVESYLCPSWMYQYHRLLQQFALGNFKSFLIEIGKTPAMLVYLNGVQNTRLDPNENYARELYELFTLGRDNGYTQTDIEETARALTGWNGFSSLCAPIEYAGFLHDNGEKTIFGQTGNWDYEDVHNLLFEQRGDEIATYICTKLYRHFVHPQVDEAIVDGLAQTFKENDFEIAPVLRQLLKSEHFFDDAIIGTQFKSPFEYYLTFINDGELPYNREIIEPIGFFTALLGQQLFSPPDVAGWPGNRSWIDGNTLTTRWETFDFYLFALYENHPQTLVNLAKALSDNSTDPAIVTQTIADYFIPNGLSAPEFYESATDAFKFEVPQNYFDENLWNLDWETAPVQVALLLRHLSRYPEFQLQ